MIGFVDETLKNLLSRELAQIEDHVYFDAPDRDFKPSLPAVDLFLYDVRENLDLRSNEWEIERTGTTATRQIPPTRVDCSYLITAWAGDIRSEHILLGDIMRVLLRYTSLPKELLVDRLQDQDLPLPTAVLQPGRLQSVGEFWQALDGKPKAALNYTVTIAVRPQPTDTAPLVVESSANLKPTAD
ncbi:MAG: DUF4255 domain-containing protein [Caldilineaceae bacterium]|nr:DUF4255 domain-containing protein [Caldilineaceae bacterium]